ncbi:hypothetical protein [Kitasatospora sp. NPDC004531]
MTDLQLAPATPSGRLDHPDDATLRRLLRGPVLDPRPATPAEPHRSAAGHCRYTLHYED